MIGTYSVQSIGNIYQPKEYNGMHKFCIKKWPQEKEFIKEILTMIKDVHHAGISKKMLTTYFSVIKEEGYGKEGFQTNQSIGKHRWSKTL